jgi:hypothetical protein
MVVPLGWMLDDRREPVPRLFNRARMDDLTDGMARPRARRQRQDKTIELLRSAVLQLTLDELGRDELRAAGAVRELDLTTRVTTEVTDATDATGAIGAIEVTAVPEVDPGQPVGELVPEQVESERVESEHVESAQAESAPAEPEHVEPVQVEPEVAAPVPYGPIGVELDQSGPMAIVLALVGDETDAAVRPESATGDEADPAGSTDAQVLPWQPRFDQEDDLKGLLKPRGRLLSRAFRGVAADGA